MPEIVGTFLRTELRDERADRSVKAWNGSRCHLAQECLEFAVRHLDGIEVRRIFRQVAQCRSRFLDSPARYRPVTRLLIMRAGYAHADAALRASKVQIPVEAKANFENLPLVD